jgi:hypothetical protein
LVFIQAGALHGEPMIFICGLMDFACASTGMM